MYSIRLCFVVHKRYIVMIDQIPIFITYDNTVWQNIISLYIYVYLCFIPPSHVVCHNVVMSSSNLLLKHILSWYPLPQQQTFITGTKEIRVFTFSTIFSFRNELICGFYFTGERPPKEFRCKYLIIIQVNTQYYSCNTTWGAFKHGSYHTRRFLKHRQSYHT